MTPDELRQKVVNAICEARNGFADADVEDEKLADAAIRTVLEAAAEVCEDCRAYYDGVYEPDVEAGAAECRDRIRALMPAQPAEMKGET